MTTAALLLQLQLHALLSICGSGNQSWQLLQSQTLGTVKLTHILACMLDSHPLLDEGEGVEGQWREAGSHICLVECIVADVLMEGLTAIATLRRARRSKKLTQLGENSRIRLLPLHITSVSVL